MISTEEYAIIAAAVFVIGLFGALTRRNAITVLMGVELMFNAANINFVAFSFQHKGIPYYSGGPFYSGQVFPLFVIAIAACEVAVGLAIILALYRSRSVINVDEANQLRG